MTYENNKTHFEYTIPTLVIIISENHGLELRGRGPGRDKGPLGPPPIDPVQWSKKLLPVIQNRRWFPCLWIFYALVYKEESERCI